MSLEEKMETLEENDHDNGVENVSKRLHVEIVGMGAAHPPRQWVYSSPKPKARCMVTGKSPASNSNGT